MPVTTTWREGGSRGFRQDVRLLEVRTEVWQNLVMINFDADAEPLAPRLAGLSEFLEPWSLPKQRMRR